MKILFLCGSPGVGKSSIAIKLAQNDKYNIIKSLTNRPKRDNDNDHIFVDKEYFNKVDLSNVAGFTKIDGYYYLSLKKQFVEDKINVYITDVSGINCVLSALPKAEVLSVLIKRKNVYIDEKRKNRNINIPSKSDVDFVVDNDTDLKSCVEVIKLLCNTNERAFFSSKKSRVMSTEERVQHYLHLSDVYKELAEEHMEDLNVSIDKNYIS